MHFRPSFSIRPTSSALCHAIRSPLLHALQPQQSNLPSPQSQRRKHCVTRLVANFLSHDCEKIFSTFCFRRSSRVWPATCRSVSSCRLGRLKFAEIGRERSRGAMAYCKRGEGYSKQEKFGSIWICHGELRLDSEHCLTSNLRKSLLGEGLPILAAFYPGCIVYKAISCKATVTSNHASKRQVWYLKQLPKSNDIT